MSCADLHREPADGIRLLVLRYDVIVALTECLIAEIEKADGVRLIANYVDSPLVWGVSVGDDSVRLQSPFPRLA